MEVRAAVAPAVEVDTRDVAELQDRALDPRRDATEVRCELVGQIGEGIDVNATRQPDRAGKTCYRPEGAASSFRPTTPLLSSCWRRFGRAARLAPRGGAARGSTLPGSRAVSGSRYGRVMLISASPSGGLMGGKSSP